MKGGLNTQVCKMVYLDLSKSNYRLNTDSLVSRQQAICVLIGQKTVSVFSVFEESNLLRVVILINLLISVKI